MVLILLLIIIFSISCNSEKTVTWGNCNVVATTVVENTDTLVVCNVKDIKDKITIKISDIVENYQLVKLENLTKEMMISPTCNIYPSENHLIIVDQNRVFSFDINGRFVRNIGDIGNGPKDIVPGIIRLQIDEVANRVYITDNNMSRIQVYNLSDGEYVGKIPLPHRAIDPTFIVNTQDSLLLMAHVPMLEDVPSAVWLQDFDGNILQKVDANNFTNPKGFWYLGFDAFYLTKRNENEILLHILCNPAKNDTLYSYTMKDNIIHPLFVVNFTGNVPDHWIYKAANSYMVTINGSTVGNASSNFHNGPQERILVDKKTLKGAYVDIVLDNHGNIPITKCRFYMWGEYLTLALSPEWVAEQCENVLRNSEFLSSEEIVRLRDICDNITGEDNIFVLYGKIK